MKVRSIISLILYLLLCFHSFGQNYDAEILKLEKEKQELQDSISRLDSKITALRNESLRTTKSDSNSQNYIISSIGWCYYINSNGNKIYVDRSFCSSNNTNLSQTNLASTSINAISNSRSYITGPRGGCYYINSNGNKTYVDRSFCSSNSTGISQTNLASTSNKVISNGRSYITGPRGGCYYINSNGNKTYVDRSFCSSNSTGISQTNLASTSNKVISNGRSYITGPRGGCYYINSNGNKTYVDRSFCSSNSTGISQTNLASTSNKVISNGRSYITGPRGGCYYINSNGNKTYVDRSFCSSNSTGISQTKNINSSQSYSTSRSSANRTIYTGPRGGKYYINSNGNKTYVKRNSTSSSYYTPRSSSSRTIRTGPRGGKYYINSKGNKTYVKKN